MEITFMVNEREMQAIESISKDFKLSVVEYCRKATIPPIEDEAVARLAKHVKDVAEIFDKYCTMLSKMNKETASIGPGYGL